ncbi:MAG: zinc ribbon domain-containing protein [Oscillospiraceae bacterium]|nr:zinc ribbon domain-containing protein [Oscillospiraceae bacterium]
MTTCINCSTENQAGNKFCSACGASILTESEIDKHISEEQPVYSPDLELAPNMDIPVIDEPHVEEFHATAEAITAEPPVLETVPVVEAIAEAAPPVLEQATPAQVVSAVAVAEPPVVVPVPVPVPVPVQQTVMPIQQALPPVPQAPLPPPYIPPKPFQHDTPPVGVGWYLGMILLFSIPIIGGIICLILCFAPKNRSRKNFARAFMIWSLICVLIFAIICFSIYYAVQSAIAQVQSWFSDSIIGLVIYLFELFIGDSINWGELFESDFFDTLLEEFV